MLSVAIIFMIIPTLGNARVDLLRFVDLYGVILQVEVDGAASHSKLLLGSLVDRLLEIAIEPQHLQKRQVRESVWGEIGSCS